MPRPLVLLALLTFLVVAAVPAARADDPDRPCGTVSTPIGPARSLTVTSVDCATGKRLARRHAARTGRKKRCDLRKARCRLDGWTCDRTKVKRRTTVACTRTVARVTWTYAKRSSAASSRAPRRAR